MKGGSREIDRENRRGSKAAVCIRPKKACYEAAIQSEDQPTLSQVEKEQSEADTASERERERASTRERERKRQTETER
jgi:hypothetical protein